MLMQSKCTSAVHINHICMCALYDVRITCMFLSSIFCAHMDNVISIFRKMLSCAVATRVHCQVLIELYYSININYSAETNTKFHYLNSWHQIDRIFDYSFGCTL